MSGRLDNEMKIESKTSETLNSLPDFVKMWELNLKVSDTTADTRRNYINVIKKFLSSIRKDTKNIAVEDITEEVVVNYLQSCQFKMVKNKRVSTSYGYQATVWFIINNFFTYLVSTGRMKNNYMSSIKRVKNRDLDRINEERVLLTSTDFVKILNEIDNDNDGEWIRLRNKAIILLFMNTGMRKTACRLINVEDIDFENHELVIIDKGAKRHEFILNDKVMEAICDWLNFRKRSGIGSNSPYLFVSLNGTEMAPRTIDLVVKKYTRRALGHELSAHKLRAGYCSILYDKTHDIEFVRRCVGHANVSTTQRYIVTKKAEKEKAAEIMADLL